MSCAALLVDTVFGVREEPYHTLSPAANEFSNEVFAKAGPCRSESRPPTPDSPFELPAPVFGRTHLNNRRPPAAHPTARISSARQLRPAARPNRVISPGSLASGLTVRHLSLEQGIEGSNPSSPANNWIFTGPGSTRGFCLPARRYLLRCEIRTPERGFVPDHLLPACTGLETSDRTGASPVPFGVGARKDRPDLLIRFARLLAARCLGRRVSTGPRGCTFAPREVRGGSASKQLRH